MSHVTYTYTDYFKKTQQRRDRKYIKHSWITDTLERPQKVQVQENGRVSHWKYVHTARKVLRVITLNDRRTVFNCYFDRDQLRRYRKEQAKKNEQNGVYYRHTHKNAYRH